MEILFADLENEAQNNDLPGFAGTFSLTIQTLAKLTAESSGAVFWQLMSQILEESSVIEKNLLNGDATLFDVTYKFQHIRDILLIALRAKYGQNF